MDVQALEVRLAASGEPAYRARQVWEWTARGVEGYEAMTNVPRAVRQVLADDVPFSTLTAEAEQRSRDGQTRRLVRRLAELGYTAELTPISSSA